MLSESATWPSSLFFHLQLSQTGPVKNIRKPLRKLFSSSLCPQLLLMAQPRITRLFTAPQITDVTQRRVGLQAPTGSSSEVLLKPALAAQVDVTHLLPLLRLRGAAQLCSHINPPAFPQAPGCKASFQLKMLGFTTVLREYLPSWWNAEASSPKF